VEDRQLAALKLAQKYWMESRNADRKLKVQMARELHGFELFSLNQLAKIVRTNVKVIAGVLEKNAKGGRFTAETLSSLIIMRQQLLANKRVSPMLLRLALQAGTSFSCIVSLTGLSYGAYYRDIPREFRREEIDEE
jgi:hypothetical protein